MRQLFHVANIPFTAASAWLLAALVVFFPFSSAFAWQQMTLSGSFTDSQTMHYGGSRAPVETAPGSMLVARVSSSGAAVWHSSDAGVNWSSATLVDTTAEQARALSASVAITWARYAPPTIHDQLGGLWSARISASAWPVGRPWVLDAAASGGDVLVLSTDAQPGKLIEGPLYMVAYAAGQWQAPVQLSAAATGDARLVRHASGLWTALWSERSGSIWRVMLANSNDGGATWGAAIQAVAGILAPLAQEAAVHVAAAAIPGFPADQLALAFTGWLTQPHSQLWSKQVDAASGTGSGLALMPDAGDMVYSPSIAVEPDGRWEVVWQQKTGIDMEIYLAERSAAGAWGPAVNVSSDPLHLNYDAHVSAGLSHSVQVAYTCTNVPGVQELYQLSLGDAIDPALDSDGDGMPDVQEIGFDMNQDGIDDAYSSKVATWMHVDGRYALIAEGNGTLAQTQALDIVSAHVTNPTNYQSLSDMLSFKVVGLALGGSTQLHLMTPHAVPADAKWMKWNLAGYWQDSGVPTWQDASGQGLHIVLTDGGTGDEDGVQNGEISDPGMLAGPNAAPVFASPAGAASGGGGGGCLVASGSSLSSSLMLLWFGAFLGLALRRQAVK